jgi:hypothetical protein
MSRRLRAFVALLLVSFAFSAVACADPTGPQAPRINTCDTSGSNVC